MGEEITRAVRLCIDLFVTSILIGIVAVLGMLSYNAYNTKLQQESAESVVRAKAELYDYDEKEVNSSDIINVTTTNARIYTFKIIVPWKSGWDALPDEIKNNSGLFVLQNSILTCEISARSEHEVGADGEEYGLRLWSDEFIGNTIIKNMVPSRTKFHSKLIKNETGDLIIGVEFIGI